MLPGIYSGSVSSPAKDIFSFTRMYFKDKTKSVKSVGDLWVYRI